MRDFMGIAYLVTCTATDRVYVGITTRPLKERWRQHQARSARHKGLLSRAILKYGTDAFAIRAIASATCLLDLKALERILITQYGSRAPAGYNLTGGGDGLFGPAQEVRDRISASLTGMVQSQETRDKRSASSKGLVRLPESTAATAAWLRGRKRRPETIAKMSASTLGRSRSEQATARTALANTGRKREGQALINITIGAIKRRIDPNRALSPTESAILRRMAKAEAAGGYKASDKTRAKLSAAITTIWQDPARRENQSIKIKAAHARRRALSLGGER